jgi:hypothetical protein
LYRAKRQNFELSNSNQALNASMAKVQTELQAVRGQLDELNTARPQPAKTPAPRVTRAVARPAPRDDPRFKQLQSQLAEQQSQLASTRQDLDKTRENLEGSLGSAKDELSGSIARTHDELVALQKRGERNYYEFQINKSKAFEKVGPLRLSLRKADTKHKRFDVTMLVDDNELQKKGVNLYETVWLNLGDRPQPLEVVVNQISKDRIAGYVSEPKYKRSELSASAEVKPKE